MAIYTMVDWLTCKECSRSFILVPIDFRLSIGCQ